MEFDMENTPKSTFVTVLSWIFIIFSGGMTLISALQNIMFYFIFPRDEMRETIESGHGGAEVPAFVKFMMSNFDILLAAIFCLSLLCFVCSIGLLKRKNWARLTFIGVMVLGIIWNIFGLIMQQFVFSDFPEQTNAAANFQEQFKNMQIIIQTISIVFSIGFSALFGWIIWKLRSSQIVAEFE
jgi:hypothetical protein